jgi:hypothetical protein
MARALGLERDTKNTGADVAKEHEAKEAIARREWDEPSDCGILVDKYRAYLLSNTASCGVDTVRQTQEYSDR